MSDESRADDGGRLTNLLLILMVLAIPAGALGLWVMQRRTVEAMRQEREAAGRARKAAEAQQQWKFPVRSEGPD